MISKKDSNEIKNTLNKTVVFDFLTKNKMICLSIFGIIWYIIQRRDSTVWCMTINVIYT
jgi:hypothetical protein